MSFSISQVTPLSSSVSADCPPILSLPTELQRLILDFLNAYEARQLRHSCRELYHSLNSELRGSAFSRESLIRLWTSPSPPGRADQLGDQLDRPLRKALKRSYRRELGRDLAREDVLMEDWVMYCDGLRQQLVARALPAIAVWREATLPVAMWIRNGIRDWTPEQRRFSYESSKLKPEGVFAWKARVHPDQTLICRKIRQRVVELFYPENVGSSPPPAPPKSSPPPAPVAETNVPQWKQVLAYLWRSSFQWILAILRGIAQVIERSTS